MPRTLNVFVTTLFFGSVAVACSDDSGDENNLSFATDIHPIFVAKCVPCHSAGYEGFPGHASDDIDESYAETIADGQSGQKVYDRILFRTDPPDPSGIMPQGCGTGLDDGTCLTTAEHELIQQWVEQGTPP